MKIRQGRGYRSDAAHQGKRSTQETQKRRKQCPGEAQNSRKQSEPMNRAVKGSKHPGRWNTEKPEHMGNQSKLRAKNTEYRFRWNIQRSRTEEEGRAYWTEEQMRWSQLRKANHTGNRAHRKDKQKGAGVPRDEHIIEHTRRMSRQGGEHPRRQNIQGSGADRKAQETGWREARASQHTRQSKQEGRECRQGAEYRRRQRIQEAKHRGRNTRHDGEYPGRVSIQEAEHTRVKSGQRQSMRLEQTGIHSI
ncbi:hypothetical protein NDU88_003334 [Pleurodeles waltl]|uniref:Uncharacterized protein n=1 Tax=Pleurodeles waltl TaxID=8319 RepID=A0AAV7RI69_PLEWA|nr:hypothetical protein NDU88_003334 [Pleurodeles waltl]